MVGFTNSVTVSMPINDCTMIRMLRDIGRKILTCLAYLYVRKEIKNTYKPKIPANYL